MKSLAIAAVAILALVAVAIAADTVTSGYVRRFFCLLPDLANRTFSDPFCAFIGTREGQAAIWLHHCSWFPQG